MRWDAEGGSSAGAASAAGAGAGIGTATGTMRLGMDGPLSRILPPATEARTVEGGRLAGLIGAAVCAVGAACIGGGSGAVFRGLIVEICPVRCARRPASPGGEAAAASGWAGRSAPAVVPAALGSRALSSIATWRKGVSISPTFSSATWSARVENAWLICSTTFCKGRETSVSSSSVTGRVKSSGHFW